MRNKYLLLWSQPRRVRAARRPRRCRRTSSSEWRRVQARRVAAERGPLDVQLRQVVVPALGAADRCVSCHVGMAPGEQGVAGHKVLGAAPEGRARSGRYGCTVCHGGQGRATDKADAHGDVPHLARADDPAPLRLRRLRQLPHAPRRSRRRRSWRAGARRLRALRLPRLPPLDGRGGTLRPGGAAAWKGPTSRASACAGYDRRLVREASRQAARRPRRRPVESSFGAIAGGDRAALDDVPRDARRRAGSGRGQGAVPLARLPRLPQGERRRRRRRARPDARGRERSRPARLHARARRADARQLARRALPRAGDDRPGLADAGARA